MDRMKQKWLKKSSQEKWVSLIKINTVLLIIYILIYSLILAFTNILEKHLQFFTALAVLFIFFFFNWCVPVYYFSVAKCISIKKANITMIIKKFINVNWFIWFVIVLYFSILPIFFNCTNSFIIKQWPKHWSFLCFFYLAAALAIWIYQLIYCKFFLKDYLLKKSSNILFIRTLHSIFISINGWLLILLNLFNFAELSRILSIAYLIISSSTILFYPSLDMFEYMSKEVDKFNRKKEKEREKERIENESNGSKNYTV